MFVVCVYKICQHLSLQYIASVAPLGLVPNCSWSLLYCWPVTPTQELLWSPPPPAGPECHYLAGRSRNFQRRTFALIDKVESLRPVQKFNSYHPQQLTTFFFAGAGPCQCWWWSGWPFLAPPSSGGKHLPTPDLPSDSVIRAWSSPSQPQLITLMMILHKMTMIVIKRPGCP